MVRQTRNIPQAKLDHVSQEEKDEAQAYHEVSDASYHAGINVGKPGFYNPEAGAAKHAVEASESDPKPVLVTDPGQPKGITAKVTGERSKASAIDRTPRPVVRSTGRKTTATKE